MMKNSILLIKFFSLVKIVKISYLEKLRPTLNNQEEVSFM